MSEPIREGIYLDTLREENDYVNHPPHYTSHPSGVECITVTEWFNFNIGNAIKYLWRSDHKNGIQDLEKAKWYIEREIKRLSSESMLQNNSLNKD